MKIRSVIAFVLLPSIALAEDLNGRWKLESSVRPFKTKTYTASFDPVAPVHVTLNGYCTKYEESNPDLFVFDAKGRLVARSTNPLCYEELQFQPTDTKTHTIVISNKKNKFKVNYELTVMNDTGLVESDEP
jgi:hypothetical protein